MVVVVNGKAAPRDEVRLEDETLLLKVVQSVLLR